MTIPKMCARMRGDCGWSQRLAAEVPDCADLCLGPPSRLLKGARYADAV